MKIRIYLEKIPITSGIFNIDSDKDIHYLRNVLRCKESDIVYIFSDTKELRTKILNISKKTISFEIIEEEEIREEVKDIVLYCAITKGGTFENIVASVTQLGIKSIVPVVMQHSTMNKLNLERMILIAKESLEQSNGFILPKIMPMINFNTMINASKLEKRTMICGYKSHHNANTYSNTSVEKDSKIGIVIGPEGGFSSEEFEIMQNNDFTFLSIGTRVLKMEVAAISLLSVCMAN